MSEENQNKNITVSESSQDPQQKSRPQASQFIGKFLI